MGINVDEARALLAMRREGMAADGVLCLGRPEIFGSQSDYQGLSNSFNLGWSPDECMAIANERYAETFLKRAGFTSIRSLDASAYEGADIVHDLNMPIPEHLHGTSNFVYDGGTIEHVFDVATAMRNVMDLTAVGGTLLISNAANGQCGHGFYQFSPELFFRLFEANGFDRIGVYLVGLNKPSRWFRVTDPRAAGRRLQFANSEPMQILLMARKARKLDHFVIPQQSDYADEQWKGTQAEESAPREEWNSLRARTRHWLRERMAVSASVLLRHTLGLTMPGLWRRSHFQPFNPATDRLQ